MKRLALLMLLTFGVVMVGRIASAIPHPNHVVADEDDGDGDDDGGNDDT